jgi:hypothetical protein
MWLSPNDYKIDCISLSYTPIVDDIAESHTALALS